MSNQLLVVLSIRLLGFGLVMLMLAQIERQLYRILEELRKR